MQALYVENILLNLIDFPLDLLAYTNCAIRWQVDRNLG